MAEAAAALINPEPLPDSDAALFHRRIEFHVARKPFNGFSGNTSNGFKLVTLNPNSEPHKAYGSGNKYEKSDLAETGLDPELSFEITFRRIPASILVCFRHFRNLRMGNGSCKLPEGRTAGFCALCAIQKHVSRALQSTGRILEPKDLVSNLRLPEAVNIKLLIYIVLGISRSFRNARQEDAHEYMVNLLESMHKCCLPSGVPSESPSAYEKSLVHKIFGGRLRSQVKCMQCSFCSNKFDPFLDLSLEILKADTLQKALSHFTAKEQLDGGAKQYQCQQCKQKVRAVKQLTIHKAPHVLTVHLKRFGSHVPGQKIDKRIAFPPTLDLKPFVTGPYDGDLKYTLYGVLVHAGWSTHSGHYYCFIRTSSGMWYSLDDNQVIQVSEKKVMEQKAYMLFYVRDRRKLGTKKPVDIVQKDNMVMNAIGNAAAYSKFNELKEKIQNGSVEKKIDGSFANAPKEIPSKKMSVQNVNGMMTVEQLSVMQPTKDSAKEYSATDIDSVGQKGESHLSDQGFGDTHVSRDSLHKKELTDSVAMPSNENLSESARQPPHSSDLGTNSEMRESKTMPMATTGEASNKVNDVKSSKQNNIEEGQVGDSSRKNGNLIIEETNENRQRMDSVQSATTEQLSREIAKNKRPQLKVKRKLFKCQVATMSLSSNIIFGVAISLRKKKLKRRKQLSLQKKSQTLKNPLGENDLPSNLGQPVSDKSLTVPVNHLAPSKKKKAKCGSDYKSQKLSKENINSNTSTSSDVISNEFRERVVPDGTTPSVSHVRQSAAQGPDNSEEYKRESKQNDVMSMLTRGLEETTVARWDGIDVSFSEKSERKAAGSAQIGYIGDEWDEEYDRGKRKKVRESKISFGGPNLFQEIATKNSKRKRAKLDQFENQQFRI
ncbi:hypothetical protein BUALT_Bualt16G0087400 [Buddleja alternifolia]|uniref:USP domain-containing protein n=1 Tax=Buddleja alternifolia TaxID=168488 RepID=A0AAV6W814_9LAMI|nr:hypothetical protein BUALT_Bualt16G0087400 [Buddleja alternifolia]